MRSLFPPGIHTTATFSLEWACTAPKHAYHGLLIIADILSNHIYWAEIFFRFTERSRMTVHDLAVAFEDVQHWRHAPQTFLHDSIVCVTEPFARHFFMIGIVGVTAHLLLISPGISSWTVSHRSRRAVPSSTARWRCRSWRSRCSMRSTRGYIFDWKEGCADECLSMIGFRTCTLSPSKTTTQDNQQNTPHVNKTKQQTIC